MTDDNVKWLRAEAETFDSLGEPGSFERGARLTAIADELEQLRRGREAYRAVHAEDLAELEQLRTLVDDMLVGVERYKAGFQVVLKYDWPARAKAVRGKK